MEALVCFVLLCMLWLTILTFRTKRQAYENKQLRIRNKEKEERIELLTNKLYGKEETKTKP